MCFSVYPLRPSARSYCLETDPCTSIRAEQCYCKSNFGSEGLPDSQMLPGWIYCSKAASVLDGELCMASVGAYRGGNVEIYLLEPQFASQHRLRNRTLESNSANLLGSMKREVCVFSKVLHAECAYRCIHWGLRHTVTA